MRSFLRARRFRRVPIASAAVALVATAVAFAVPLAAEPASTSSWTRWGGADGNFVAANERGVIRPWSAEGPRILWQQTMGAGESAVLVEGDVLYTFHRAGEGASGEEIVRALKAADGSEIWAHRYTVSSEPTKDQATEFGRGPRATPLLAGDRLFTIGFAGDFHAYDKRSGKMLWSTRLVEDHGAKRHRFGYSHPPVMIDGRVMLPIGSETVGLAGFDPATGEMTWKSAPASAAYAVPLAATLDGVRQLLYMSETHVVGFDPKSGEQLWAHPHKNQYLTNVLGPWVVDGKTIFVSANTDAGSRTLTVEAEDDGTFRVKEIARNKKLRIFHQTAILDGDTIYASDGGILHAYDVRQDKTLWRERGFAKSNIVKVAEDNTVLLLTEDGALALARLGTDGLTKLADKVKLLDKPAWTPPTVVGTTAYLRDRSRLIAIDLSGAPADASSGR
ncbi:MAG: PQQ-binding-like beta-propeller repeat protein [Acidobacteriota bacterium]